MARKKKHPEHINHERWLVSYADFITLLFAFFVVMFAVSPGGLEEGGALLRGVLQGGRRGHVSRQGDRVSPEAAPTEKKKQEGGGTGGSDMGLPRELIEVKKAIEKKKEETALAGLQVVTRRNELVLRMADNIFFDLGSDTLKQPAIDILKTIAPELIKRNVDVRIEGHTDSRPISTARFHSNWDLSTARATAVIAKLAADGMPPPRLAAAGYGEFRPIAPNDTDDGRRQNRRVDLIISMAAPPEMDVAAVAPTATPDSKEAPKDGPKEGKDAKDAPKETTSEAAPAKDAKDAKDPKDTKDPKSGKTAKNAKGKPASGVAEADDGTLKEIARQP